MLADRESGADYRERVAQRYPPTGVSVSCVMAKSKPKTSDPKPVDYSSLFVAGKQVVSSASIGVPGKTYKPSGTGPAYVGPKLRGGDKGVFAGSSTPLGSSLAGTKTGARDVIGAALLVTSLPAAAGSVPAVVGGKIMQKALQRYVAPSVVGAMDKTFTAATKGLNTMRGGGRIYEANTVLGPMLASTKIASNAQTAARLSNLESNALRITEQAGIGAFKGAANIVKDLKTGKKIVKGAAGLAGLAAIKNNKRK